MSGLIGVPAEDESTLIRTLARLPGAMLEMVPTGISAARNREAK
jgi:hypothetical protein